MKAQGFRTMYGFENQAHLGSKENTLYVIPGGKGYDHEGVEVCISYLILSILPSLTFTERRTWNISQIAPIL